MRALLRCLSTAAVAFWLVLEAGAAAPLIVDWGHDWGAGWYRERPDQQGNPRQLFEPRDLNGNGSTEDDQIGGWAFSLSEPLSPTNLCYDYTLPSARFYGGAVIRVSGMPQAEPGKPPKNSSPTEGHINQNHELRDDWNLMAMPGKKREPGAENFAGALLCLWKKEDFLNGGAAHRVSFGEDGMLAVFISRYWGGINWGRWVVQNGETLYVSKSVFADQTAQFDLETSGSSNGATNPVVRRSHVISPAAAEWAVYAPEAPDAMFFDPSNATFEKRKLDDVRAVGFLAQRDMSPGRPVANGLWALPHGLGEPVALKFNAVQARATVHGGDETGANMPLVATRTGDGKAPLRVGRTEVTFAQWNRVLRWAVTNQRASNFPEQFKALELPGYSFFRDGAIGSMETGHAGPWSLEEPVTTISWIDAVVWCNALSELEGLEPAYYVDKDLKKPYRRVIERHRYETADVRVPVYWKRNAAGYRLPSKAEWLFLVSQAGKGEPDTSSAWIAANSGGRTRKAGSLAATAQGLHDLFGNVAEWVWDGGDMVDPATATVSAMGGSFRYPEDENASGALPFASRPAQGCPGIGFRVVRGPDTGVRESGAAPERRISPELVVKPSRITSEEELRQMALSGLRFVDVPKGALVEGVHPIDGVPKAGTAYDAVWAGVEVPYVVWNAVRQWAEAEKGFRFNFRGDIGNMRMDVPENAGAERFPDEPVCGISWVDAAVWCNVLSELFGLEPAIRDAVAGDVLRVASPFRVETYAPYRYANKGNYKDREVDTAAVLNLEVRTAASGFRLPASVEYEPLFDKGSKEDRGWFLTNAGMRTHPVGSKSGDARGMYDVAGNAAEWVFGGSSLFGQMRWGTCFAYPPGVLPHRANLSESPFVARPYLGFRPLRRR